MTSPPPRRSASSTPRSSSWEPSLAERWPISRDVDLAVARLQAGGLVVIPTETVYGLGADAENPAALARVFAVKGRPLGHPLIVHLPDAAALDDGWAAGVPDAASVLATACWPGPLTLLLRRGPRVLDDVTGGRDTVGLRVPAHPLTQRLLRRSGRAIAAPSANRFGRVSPTTADHVATDLGARLDPARDLILDGGPCPVGVESTIVDCSVDPPQLLRPGGIAGEDIERLLGRPLDGASGPIRAAGMLASHYAPGAAVELASDRADAERLVDAHRRAGRVSTVIAGTGDLVVDARDLYTRLRAADDEGADVIVAVLPPADGLGHALRDRLTKAAAPR
ncbi:MAG: L-threonylcarbamoyladenylate synthase [Desertimonas sp.]